MNNVLAIGVLVVDLENISNNEKIVTPVLMEEE